MEGNDRYVEGKMKPHDFISERPALGLGQNPFAGILGCADSRIGPEYAFDVGRGDVFVCRVAGNFADDFSIASFEYTVAVLGTPLILVLGHNKCGAVDATVKAVEAMQKALASATGRLSALQVRLTAQENEYRQELETLGAATELAIREYYHTWMQVREPLIKKVAAAVRTLVDFDRGRDGHSWIAENSHCIRSLDAAAGCTRGWLRIGWQNDKSAVLALAEEVAARSVAFRAYVSGATHRAYLGAIEPCLEHLK